MGRKRAEAVSTPEPAAVPEAPAGMRLVGTPVLVPAPAVSEVPAAVPAANGQQEQGGKTSNREAIIAALRAGITKPKAVVDWVKENYGLEVTTGYVSNTKVHLGKEDRAGATQGFPPERGRKRQPPQDTGQMIPLSLLTELSQLAGKYGADTVAKAAQALATAHGL